MIIPRVLSFDLFILIAFAAKRRTLNVPFKLISMTFLNCSSGAIVPLLLRIRLGNPIPAQLKVPFTVPNFLTVFSNAIFTLFSIRNLQLVF